MARPSPTRSIERRTNRLRRGVVLALLALVVQAFAGLLPMPAHAAGRGAPAALCGPGVPADPGAKGRGKGAPQAPAACAVCQAVHFGGYFGPTPAPDLGAGHLAAGWRPLPVAGSCLAEQLFPPQQARAPPSI